MKRILVILILTFTSAHSQIAKYGNLTKKNDYASYITKNNDTIKIGDTLIIGIPTSDFGFIFITQGNAKVSSSLSNVKVIIDKLKSWGANTNSYKMYALFKGYGLVPIYIDYESALETGEVKNLNAKLTREEAIAKLKEAKELLELELITNEQYQKLIEELTPIIMN